MLILTRRSGEGVTLELPAGVDLTTVTVWVTQIREGKMKFAFDAPQRVRIKPVKQPGNGKKTPRGVKMAKVVNDYVFIERVRPKFGGATAKYKWAEWFDGNTHCLTQGDDFDIAPKALVSQIGTQAWIKKIMVNINVDGPNVFVKKVRDLTNEEIGEQVRKRSARKAAIAEGKAMKQEGG